MGVVMRGLTRAIRPVELLAASLLLAALAHTASAGETTIQYQIVGGTTDVLVSPTPYFGGGTYTVRFQANSAAALIAGSSTLVTLNVGAGPSRPGLLGAVGTYPTSQFTLPNFATVVGASVTTGFRNVLGTFYITGYPPIPTGTADFGFAQWGLSGANGRLTLVETVSSFFVVPNTVASFVGSEISRSYVPEPASGYLALSGLASLAGLAAARRRRTRRRGSRA